MDVGRQGHLAGCGHDGVRVSIEAHGADAISELFPHLDPVAASKRHDVPDTQPSRWSYERLPSVLVGAERSEDEDLGRAAARADALQLRRDHA